MRRDDKAIITQIKWISKRKIVKRKLHRSFMCEIKILWWRSVNCKSCKIYDYFSLISDESTVQSLRGASGRVPFWRFHVRRLQGNYSNVMKLSIKVYDKFNLFMTEKKREVLVKVGVIKSDETDDSLINSATTFAS